MTPLSPTEPWGATIVGVELDNTFEQTAHVALTSLCESRLNDTAVMPIALFLIRKYEDLVWMQRLQAMTDLEGPHFHADLAAMIEYAQYMFNLQQNTIKTVVQQRLLLTLLE
jgi:hypothetical protein